MKVIASDINNQVSARFIYLEGVDTTNIDKSIYLKEALILQGKTKFTHSYITICKKVNDYETIQRVFNIVSGNIETIQDLRKYFILQLAYNNIVFDNNTFKYSYEVEK